MDDDGDDDDGGGGDDERLYLYSICPKLWVMHEFVFGKQLPGQTEEYFNPPSTHNLCLYWEVISRMKFHCSESHCDFFGNTWFEPNVSQSKLQEPSRLKQAKHPRRDRSQSDIANKYILLNWL